VHKDAGKQYALWVYKFGIFKEEMYACAFEFSRVSLLVFHL